MPEPKNTLVVIDNMCMSNLSRIHHIQTWAIAKLTFVNGSVVCVTVCTDKMRFLSENFIMERIGLQLIKALGSGDFNKEPFSVKIKQFYYASAVMRL